MKNLIENRFNYVFDYNFSHADKVKNDTWQIEKCYNFFLS